MPAEQLERNTVLTPSTDLYAAAGLCIYLLTGEGPFLPQQPCNNARDYRAACLSAHRSNQHNWQLGNQELMRTLTRATDSDPEKRYQSGRELIDALRRFA